ncbi:hypothetical protein K505DRAFT_331005 [Melanomma pulvis-pyrius CBS 109.77]|uniref:Uncharacterized protein n=1 Tax=Melanomma pulvis-pyrius CBS 109.77 TaxID=1314802 RepID=A0A6A6XXW2_9PLEO|nr:hypothetical protein K505DRAFT_331005 [Melanomma pulvis-pyrius CBS 109.77]
MQLWAHGIPGPPYICAFVDSGDPFAATACQKHAPNPSEPGSAPHTLGPEGIRSLAAPWPRPGRTAASGETQTPLAATPRPLKLAAIVVVCMQYTEYTDGRHALSSAHGLEPQRGRRPPPMAQIGAAMRVPRRQHNTNTLPACQLSVNCQCCPLRSRQCLDESARAGTESYTRRDPAVSACACACRAYESMLATAPQTRQTTTRPQTSTIALEPPWCS